jgi:hypothetical protein
VLHPARFGLAGALLCSRRCSDAALDARLALAGEGEWLALVDQDTLARRPDVAAPFARVAVLDPAASAAAQAVLDGLPIDVHVHTLVGPQERGLASRLHATRAPREVAARVWRALADGPVTADALYDRLLDGADAPDARETAWALEVLEAAGLASLDGDAYDRTESAPARVDLADVVAFAEAAAAHAEGEAVLAGARPAMAVA